ncbi:MAG: hypothetical protein KC561_20000, partial [Myxococcales bacterium]|nr:hypothetical protein [Myxococcales bacterium]
MRRKQKAAKRKNKRNQRPATQLVRSGPPTRRRLKMESVGFVTLENGFEAEVFDAYAPLFTAEDALGVACSGSPFETATLHFSLSVPGNPRAAVMVSLGVVAHPECGLCVVHDGLDTNPWKSEPAEALRRFQEELSAVDEILDLIDLQVTVCSAILFTLRKRTDLPPGIDFGDSLVIFEEDLPSLTSALEAHMSRNASGNDGFSLDDLEERLGTWGSIQREPPCE